MKTTCTHPGPRLSPRDSAGYRICGSCGAAITNPLVLSIIDRYEDAVLRAANLMPPPYWREAR